MTPMRESPANDNETVNETPHCPICGRPRTAKHRPFCSRRCADVDLHRWLKGAYVISGGVESAEEASPTADAHSSESGEFDADN
jgi:uncharacterized protein